VLVSLKFLRRTFPGNVISGNVCPGCPGNILSGKRLVRETSVRETSVRESDCLGNVCKPFDWLLTSRLARNSWSNFNVNFSLSTRGVQKLRRLTQLITRICTPYFVTFQQSPANEMHLAQHFYNAQMLLLKNCWSCSFSQPFHVQKTFSFKTTARFACGDLDPHPTNASLGQPKSTPQTESRSVQLFWQDSRLRQTNRPTDRHTHHATQSATIGCTYMVVRYSLIISCAILYWQMVLTSRTISVKFIMSVCIRLRTFWTPLVSLVVLRILMLQLGADIGDELTDWRTDHRRQSVMRALSRGTARYL